MFDSLHLKIHKKLDGLAGFVKFFLRAMLRLTARNIGDKLFQAFIYASNIESLVNSLFGVKILIPFPVFCFFLF